MRQVVVGTAEPWLDEGYGASVLDLFESLTKLGYSVKILVASSRSRVIEKGRLHIKGLAVDRHIPIVTKVRFWASFLQFVLQLGDLSGILVDFYFLPALFPIRILRKTRAMMLILSRPVAEEAASRLDAMYFRLSLLLAKYLVDAVTAITPMEAEAFRRAGNLPIQKLLVIPSPVGEIFFEHKPPLDADETRRELGMDLLVNKKVVLYHGEIEEYRSITEVVNEFTKAFRDRDDIVLLIVGEGSARKPLEMRIRRNELRKCVVMGPVPYQTVPRIMSSCDVGLVILPDRPCWRNQCPTKLVEFLAMGKPVVASDLPGIRWASGNSPLVTYVKNFKAEELRHAITTALATDRAARETGSERARAFSSRGLASKFDSIMKGEA